MNVIEIAAMAVALINLNQPKRAGQQDEDPLANWLDIDGEHPDPIIENPREWIGFNRPRAGDLFLPHDEVAR